jgi:pimeloyl-ACP methyl ester carboxylesterase
VSPVHDPGQYSIQQSSALNSSEISSRSLQALRELDLEGIYWADRPTALQHLQARAEEDAAPEKLYTLAELAYLVGKETEHDNRGRSVPYYYLCAAYAYHYLLPANRNEPEALQVFDPRFRLACDFYNAGLAKCLRLTQSSPGFDPAKPLRLPCPDGRLAAVRIEPHGFAWKAEDFGPFLFCEDYAISGLENQHRSYGLGVPLMGMLRAVPNPPPHVFYPRQTSFPATALLRFDGSIADVRTRAACTLELFNPLASSAIEVAKRTVPLQADLTTPLAYFLANSDWDCLAYEGFLRADKLSRRTGIYMFEPYQPGKIPVLMVHGLLSSPVTWAPLFNDLRADPRLRERFQFWFYLYPTVDPYLETAADLRQSLRELRDSLDKDHQDDALDQMVLVGHSMGGLVSRLLTVSSGDDFWKLISPEPLKEVKATPDARAELERLFFFDPLPFVKKVVFLGTPHHGSSLSPSPPAKLVEQFVKLPSQMVTTLRTVAEDNPLVWPAARKGNLPTSVDLLDPKAPALQLLAMRPRPTPVHYHSIIGVLPHPDLLIEAFAPGGDSKQGTDGIVPYTSAHLDGVDSEIIVPADHSHVHQHPHSIAEVRRILFEHLANVPAPAATAKPLERVQARN